MTAEVNRLLITDSEGTYLDLTAGGGGHMLAVAHETGERAHLYGIDRDPEAVKRTQERLVGLVPAERIICGSFSEMDKLVEQFDDALFDGILMDLGLSSYQLDESARGFSFQSDGDLDMRFDRSKGRPASKLIEQIDRTDLIRLIKEFGEERQAARIASAIVKERQKVRIDTTGQLTSIVSNAVAPPNRNKALARVYQALRIAVNEELEQIRDALPSAIAHLRKGGRLVVLSYHSLEDRIIKRFLVAEAKGRCNCPPDLAVCLCGASPTMKLLTRKPIPPTDEEIGRNVRARSARLRAGERL